METKTYVFGDGSGSGNSGMWGWLANLAQNRGVDPNVLAMMNNNGGWGNGMGNWIWFFFIILLWGGNGWGGSGLTASSYRSRSSVCVIGRATSVFEFQNTYDHEKGHVTMHIAEALGIDPFGEELQYLAGEIGRKTYPVARMYLCSRCGG